MNYFGTTMNDSMFACESAAALKDKAFHAVKFDNDGNVALCDTEGEVVLGVLPAEEGNKAKGDTITVQIKDIALMVAGGEIAAGAAVTTDANGKAKAATAGKFILGYALKAATGEGKVIPVQICKCPSYSGGGGSLPDNFPAEDIANAGKLFGFDQSGNYDVVDMPERSEFEPFVVTMDLDDPASPTKLVSDHTFGEIHTAHMGGRTVMVKVPANSSATTIFDVSKDAETNVVTIYFLSAGVVKDASGDALDNVEFPI